MFWDSIKEEFEPKVRKTHDNGRELFLTFIY